MILKYKLMQKVVFVLLSILLLGCGASQHKNHKKLEFVFLDEYIFPQDVKVDNTIVGGLSGIDYHNGKYYLVCDDASNPIYYEATIAIKNKKITNISIDKVVLVKDSTKFLDLEAIRYSKNANQLVLTSEGHIRTQKDPLFFMVNAKGTIENEFTLPSAFKATSKEKPRHNGTLEGLSNSIDGKGYWIAMELPLEIDGPEPQLTKTNSPVRITYIDGTSKQPTKQFAFKLGNISKTPKNKFAVNGLTDVLEYANTMFFVIERSYASGLGTQGNTVKIFKIDASKATNTLSLKSLKDIEYTPAKKELIFDFEQIRELLTNKSVDNIEGITFGPVLPNGHKTLIAVSDNNFSKFEKQLNQFILFEIVD